MCLIVEVEGSVPVGEIRTVTTDHQTNRNNNYVNYSTLPLLNTITQKCYFLYLINTTTHYVPCVQHNMSGVTEPVLQSVTAEEETCPFYNYIIV